MAVETPTRLQNQVPVERPREVEAPPGDELSMELITGGSVVEAVGGAAGVVLAILGLAGVFPTHLGAIAAIALGAGLLFQGGAITMRIFRLMSETATTTFSASELGSGVTAEFLGGVAGVALGILALLGLVPLTLLPIAAIVFGSALILGSGATCRLNCLTVESRETHPVARAMARELVWAATATQVLVGLAAAVLGILALVGIAPLVLTLVAFLSTGCAVLMSGTALTSKMLSMLWR